MSMTGSSHIFRSCSVFHGQHSFADHFSCIRTDDVDAQYSIRVLISQYLHEALTVSRASRSGIGLERKESLRIRYPGFLQLFLGLSHCSELREGVDDSGNSIVIHMSRESRDNLCT